MTVNAIVIVIENLQQHSQKSVAFPTWASVITDKQEFSGACKTEGGNTKLFQLDRPTKAKLLDWAVGSTVKLTDSCTYAIHILRHFI